VTIIDASIMINSSGKTVWEVLSDLALIARYDPTVQTSEVVSPEAAGIGATRDILLANGDRLRESVTIFDPRKRIELEMYTTSMALKSLHRSYSMDDEGKRTRVTLEVEYEMKYGMVGSLLERFWFRKRLGDVVHAGLYSIKRYVEVGKR
jgi:ribosome-associated toxin RatA of RatAB toxin-antitoxin module